MKTDGNGETEIVNISGIIPFVSAQKMHSKLSIAMVMCGTCICVGESRAVGGEG